MQFTFEACLIKMIFFFFFWYPSRYAERMLDLAQKYTTQGLLEC